MQRGFHIIFAAAAVDSVRRNFCSSYVSLGGEGGERNSNAGKMNKGGTENVCECLYVSKEASFPSGKYFRSLRPLVH